MQTGTAHPLKQPLSLPSLLTQQTPRLSTRWFTHRMPPLTPHSLRASWCPGRTHPHPLLHQMKAAPEAVLQAHPFSSRHSSSPPHQHAGCSSADCVLCLESVKCSILCKRGWWSLFATLEAATPHCIFSCTQSTFLPWFGLLSA